MLENEMNKNLREEIDRRKEEIGKYAKAHTKLKLLKDGSTIPYVEFSPIAVNEIFFKKLQKPKEGMFLYSAEELEEFYEAYREIVTQINEELGVFPTSLSSFCKFIGITIDTLRGYRDTKDLNLKRVIDTIYEEIGDDNLFVAQLGGASEKSTLFRLKSQNEMQEKKSPNVNVSIKALVNNAKYDAKLEKYKDLIDAK
jgi:hypothetical protein